MVLYTVSTQHLPTKDWTYGMDNPEFGCWEAEEIFLFISPDQLWGLGYKGLFPQR
jgi:hypothetical protein